MIIAYDIITASTVTDLAVRVHECLRDGWQPYGDVFITQWNGYLPQNTPEASSSMAMGFAQAMVKVDTP